MFIYLINEQRVHTTTVHLEFDILYLISTQLTESFLPYPEVFVNLVNQRLEEVEGVLLLPDVHSLTPELEHLPETLRFMVL